MMRIISRIALAGSTLLLGACVSMPSGPSVMVLPGTGKSFDQFRADDMDCRQFANSQVGGSTAEQAQADSAVKSAAVGTAVGALAGALIGGHQGAGAGAATGLIIGGASGAGAGNASGRTLQQRYDIGYTQCMYAKGHQVPSSGRAVAPRPAPAAVYYPPPPPPNYGAPPPSANAVPPPPPGTPPPPPPGTH
jgi:hypothetical protein